MALFAASILFDGDTRSPYADGECRKTFKYQIDINGAASAEIQTLPGIGEKLAGAIIERREKAGHFRGHEELLDVRGIGSKRFEAIKPFLLEMGSKDDLP